MTKIKLKKKKTIMINMHNMDCNEINYNVIFLDEINFDVMKIT
jgi:hypothetical protein